MTSEGWEPPTWQVGGRACWAEEVVYVNAPCNQFTYKRKEGGPQCIIACVCLCVCVCTSASACTRTHTLWIITVWHQLDYPLEIRMEKFPWCRTLRCSKSHHSFPPPQMHTCNLRKELKHRHPERCIIVSSSESRSKWRLSMLGWWVASVSSTIWKSFIFKG